MFPILYFLNYLLLLDSASSRKAKKAANLNSQPL